MPHVIFVCTGNICRSPYAEALARHLSDDTDTTWGFSSAGTGALVDSPADPLMAAEVERRGASLADFRSRQFVPAMASSADLILTMEARQRLWVMEESPALMRRTFVLAQFVEEAGRHEGLGGRELIDAVVATRPRVLPEHDVPDPYRRGPEVAAHTAQILTGLVSSLVAGLRRSPAARRPAAGCRGR